MDAFFTGLTKRQTMLLLTAVTFGGSDGVQSFDHLPDDEAEILRDRAKQILAIPRDKRVPFLVGEIKRFVTTKRADVLRAADASTVAKALEKERPAVVELVLRGLPSSVADQVRRDLALAPVQLKKEVRPEVVAVIRHKVEEQLAASAPMRSGFTMNDLLTLQQKDVVHLGDILGARALGPALSGLPDDEREAFLKGLLPDQRQLANRFVLAARARKLAPDDARDVLARAAHNKEPREKLRLAGLRRLARACVAESPELAARLIERHSNDLGRALARLVSEERQGAAQRRGGDLLRGEVLKELERLADQGIIDRPVRLPPPPLRAGQRPAAATRQPVKAGAPRAERSPAEAEKPGPPVPGSARFKPMPSSSSSQVKPAPGVRRGGAAAPDAKRSIEDVPNMPGTRPKSRG